MVTSQHQPPAYNSQYLISPKCDLTIFDLSIVVTSLQQPLSCCPMGGCCGEVELYINHILCFSDAEIIRKIQEEVKGRKWLSCQYCGKNILRPADLVKHERIHTGEKPYSCEYCGKMFSDSSAYYRHRRRHTGEKRFGCDICGKRFAEKCAWKSHQVSHYKKKMSQK